MSLDPELADFLKGPAHEVAPALLGATFAVRGVAVVLTEVEAYAGACDPASHAFRGLTARTAVMFGPPGRLYVYLSHGIHHCVNLVTGHSGEAGAVLLRAGRVVAGIETAALRRPRVDASALGRGPGNLGRILGVTRADTGLVLGSADVTLRLAPPADAIRNGPRVGVSRAADIPWRFWLSGEPSVSGYRRSPRAETPAEGR